jgi:eukaryotic-like serine/threonine-protein kinase
MIPGRIVDDKYRIRRVIGRGGMSVVVEADHLHLGHKVAIKFLRTDVARALAAEPRFFREARLAARLTSNHTCRVSDVGIWESGPYLVLELLNGRTLNQELRERKILPVPEACEVILQACDALAEAHALGIVHRDVKPGNFFLCADQASHLHVKVLDFGVAKIPAAVVTRNGEGSLTDGNTLIGTPSYISPEQLQNSKVVDARSDIWGLGVILYEMLAGHPPFRDAWVPRMLVKIAKEPHIPIREIRPSIPPAVDQVIERCLSKNPADRYASAADLGLALADLALPSEEILERLMAFGTSVPRLATFSSNPPRDEGEPDALELDFVRNNSLDPFTTSVKRSRNARVPRAYFAAGAGILFGLLMAAGWLRYGSQLRRPHSTLAQRDVDTESAVSSRGGSNVDRKNAARLELFATPAQTQWLLDGVLLGSTPYQGNQPRDQRTHTLVAQAPGYEPRSLTVYFDRDLSLSLALDKTILPAAAVPPLAARPSKAGRETVGRTLDSVNPYGAGE